MITDYPAQKKTSNEISPKLMPNKGTILALWKRAAVPFYRIFNQFARDSMTEIDLKEIMISFFFSIFEDIL